MIKCVLTAIVTFVLTLFLCAAAIHKGVGRDLDRIYEDEVTCVVEEGKPCDIQIVVAYSVNQ